MFKYVQLTSQLIPSRKEITHTKQWENGESMVPGKVDHTVRF